MAPEALSIVQKTPPVDDRPLWDVVIGLYGNQALLLAHHLTVFELLADGPRSLSDICEALKIRERPADAILTTATSLGFLSLKEGFYALTLISETYLLAKSPHYFGHFWDLIIENDQFHAFASLKKVILTVSPQPYGKSNIYHTHLEQAEVLKKFTTGMHSISITGAFVWPDAIDLSSHRVMIDIAGTSPAEAIGAALKLPNLKVFFLDFPQVCALAQPYINQYGLTDRIETVGMNIWCDRWPTGDLHFFSNIFHEWPMEKCHFLTAKSFNSLESGGRIVIHEVLYNDEKTGPFFPAAYSMMMMAWTEGRQYSGKELATMLKEIGFEDIEVHKVFGYYSIVTGRKP